MAINLFFTAAAILVIILAMLEALKSLIILTVVVLCIFVTAACDNSSMTEPTVTPEPSPISTTSPEPATPTPETIDWASIGMRINQLSTDSGLTLHEVKQLTEDIVEVSTEGNCTAFASLIDAEPDFVLLGKPQLAPQGICTIWFRVLAD